MWLEAILTRDDLARLLGRSLPVTIHLGDPPDDAHTLFLSDLGGDVRLVPDVGLRVVCKARVRWPVLGIGVPISVNSLTIVLLPAIGKGPSGDTLVFRVSVEHADVAGMPAMIDDRITDAINAKLAAKNVELSWDFSKTLSHVFSLPKLLDPLDAVALRVAWGKVRITEEALVFAVSFDSDILRRGEDAPPELT